MKNIVTIMGPHGAGKDSLMRELYAKFNFSHPGLFYKLKYNVTRKIRSDEVEGEDVYISSENDFLQLIQEGKMACNAKAPNYRVGSQKSEFDKAKFTLFNALYSVIPQVINNLAPETVNFFKIYIFAPFEVRFERIKKRNPELSDEEVKTKLSTDVNILSETELNEMDMYLENKDGQLNELSDLVAKELLKNFVAKYEQS